MKNVLLSVMLTLGLACGGPMACMTSPATGDRVFAFMDKDQEVRLGEEAEPQFLAEYGGEVPSQQVLGYVQSLGNELAAVSERADLPWTFHVLNSPVINAFALPGGKVFVSRGLLEKMDNAAQLAGVLGHEVGHVTDLHMPRRMAQAMGLNIAGVALGVAGEASDNDYLKVLGVGTQVGGGVYLLGYGRDQEHTADELGLRYMTRLNYDPSEMVEVMRILEEASGAGGGAPEWLSTHPNPGNRIEHLKELIRERYSDVSREGAYRIDREEFERNVLGPLRRLPPAPPPKQQQGG